jgi:hypothetical protein
MATYWNDGLDAGQWVTIITSASSVLVTLIVAVIAARLAHRYAVRQANIAQDYHLAQARMLHNTTVQTDRLRREIAALEQVWSLLAYMSDKKSDQAIIHWQTQRQGNQKITHYYFAPQPLKTFALQKTSEVFYQQHTGLFISNTVRDLMFGYRAIIMGFYMAHQVAIDNGDSELIAITNTEQVEKLKNIYTELNTLLRQELEQRYAKLLVPDTPLRGGNAR